MGGVLAKPGQFVDAAAACAAIFANLRSWFDVGPTLTADISTIDSPTVVRELHDPQLVAAFAMRRLQALHHLAEPGVKTTVDVIVHNLDAVLRALIEAPGKHLTRRAEGLDWDLAWATYDAGMLIPEGCPQTEAEAYKQHVLTLIEARAALIDLAAEAGTRTLIVA